MQTFIPHDFDLAESGARTQQSFFNRLLRNMMQSRQQQANCQITQYLYLMRGSVSDTLWREIERSILCGH